jgi:predicted transcriptional regulator
MVESVVVVRLRPEVSEELDALARDTKRRVSDLATEAIETYVNLNPWQIAHIKQALAEDDAGGPAVSHEDVVEWLRSWGTDHELPRRPIETIRRLRRASQLRSAVPLIASAAIRGSAEWAGWKAPDN